MAPKTVDRDEKARLIIKHATTVFARTGYNATTIDAIAVRAKIGKGTIYEYFDSKQDLFLAVFNAYMDQYFKSLQPHIGDSTLSAAAQLRETTRATFALSEEAVELFPLVFEFWAASASPEMRDRVMDIFRGVYSTFRELFAGMIRRGIEAGEFLPGVDVDSTTAVLVGSIDGLFLQAWFDKDIDPMKAGTAFMDVLIRGLKAPAAGAQDVLAGGGHA